MPIKLFFKCKTIIEFFETDNFLVFEFIIKLHLFIGLVYKKSPTFQIIFFPYQ